MNTKARITYRFDKENGALEKQIPQQEKRSQSPDVVPFIREELTFTQAAPKWNSPFQDDTFALEQLIRQTDEEAAPVSRPSNKKPELILEDDFVEHEISSVNARQANMASYTHSPAYEIVEEESYSPQTVPLGDEESEISLRTDAYPVRPANLLESEAAGPIIDPELLDREMRRADNSFLTRAPATYRSHRGPSWIKVMASVAGAVATGALFGYLVLTIFTGGGSTTDPAALQPAASSSSQADAGAPAAAADQAAGDDTTATVKQNEPTSTDQTAAAGKRIAVDVPAISYAMLQYGVFSNKAGMEAAVAELKGKGLAASSYSSGSDYRVYAGMSSGKDDAGALKAVLPNVEVYVKQVEVPGITSLAFTGKAEEAQLFFTQTAALLSELDAYSSTLLEQGTVSGTKWQSAYQTWTVTAQKMEQGLVDKASKQAVRQLAASLKSAASAGAAYAKQPDDVQLWTIQTSIMDAVFTLKAWTETNLSL